MGSVFLSLFLTTAVNFGVLFNNLHNPNLRVVLFSLTRGIVDIDLGHQQQGLARLRSHMT